jgi:phosphoadenosine phosphosulfate reductase
MTAPSTNVELFESMSAAELVDAVLSQAAGRRACLTCSFQAEDIAVLHLLRKHAPDIAVLFLETGYHFAETYEFRDRIAREWSLHLVNVMPAHTVAEQEAAHGILYRSNPTQCCQLRKVEPLMRALAGYDVWFTGLRREQSPTRKNLKKVEQHRLPDGQTILKVSPLADWPWSKVWEYTGANRLEYLPLYDRGYTSIGCEPCTAVPAEGADPRSGRWGGRKLECGIHTFSEREALGPAQREVQGETQGEPLGEQ